VERTVTMGRQRLSKLPTAALYYETAYQVASANTAVYRVFLSSKYTFCYILLTPSWCYNVKVGGGHEDLAGRHGPLCPPLGYGPGCRPIIFLHLCIIFCWNFVLAKQKKC